MGENCTMSWRPRFGVSNGRWKGGRVTDGKGYVRLYRPEHPYASGPYVYEHRLVVESALGHVLPKTAVVHHVNDRPDDNRNSNLVALQDDREHNALHMRRKVLRAGGNP